MNTPTVAYRQLLNRLCALEPHCGFTSAAQIGDLTDAELAALLQHEPTVLADAACSAALVRSIATTLATEGIGLIVRSAMLGAAIHGCLRAQARTYLLGVVQDELAQRDEQEPEQRKDVLTADQRMAVELGLGRQS